jgi:hypothetical protein
VFDTLLGVSVYTKNNNINNNYKQLIVGFHFEFPVSIITYMQFRDT